MCLLTLVFSLLLRGKPIDALVRSLEDPAYGPVDEELKVILIK
jgi:hypothetical protein